jgi:hypothetical protein
MSNNADVLRDSAHLVANSGGWEGSSACGWYCVAEPVALCMIMRVRITATGKILLQQRGAMAARRVRVGPEKLPSGDAGWHLGGSNFRYGGHCGINASLCARASRCKWMGLALPRPQAYAIQRVPLLTLPWTVAMMAMRCEVEQRVTGTLPHWGAVGWEGVCVRGGAGGRQPGR